MSKIQCFLNQSFSLFLTDKPIPKRFDINESIFQDTELGDFLGFYDWLRNDEELVIGVRFIPFERIDFLYQYSKQLDYVTIEKENKYLEIFFRNVEYFNEWDSNDQDFGECRIFKNMNNQLLISFDAENLNENELLIVKQTAKMITL